MFLLKMNECILTTMQIAAVVISRIFTEIAPQKKAGP